LAGKAQHEVDVMALAVGEQRHARHARIVVIGEAKPPAESARLPTWRSWNGSAPEARLLVFARSGFTPRLVEAPGTREDVELVHLARRYHGG